jgi:hypothetical protein
LDLGFPFFLYEINKFPSKDMEGTLLGKQFWKKYGFTEAQII